MRALNGLQFILRNEGPQKEAFSSFVAFFPQPVEAMPTSISTLDPVRLRLLPNSDYSMQNP